MAENKKSFVLYSDLIHTVRKMPRDKAGDLLMTILEYVNDENPVVTDMVVDLVFEPVKQQLKRDLVKYEGKKQQWSDAGKKSAKVRSERSTVSTDVKSRSTVSTVNVSVNDNVSVNVNYKEKINPSDFEFSLLLLRLILGNNPKAKKPNFNKWCDEFRLIREIDKRDEKAIGYLINWTQANSFWKTNILSPSSLRKHFDKLIVTVKAEKDKPAEKTKTIDFNPHG